MEDHSEYSPNLNIIVPLFNEEENFDDLILRLKKILNESKIDIEVILIDDGSTDNTSSKMRELSLQNEKFQSVFLSRNFGHQLALSAGLSYVNAKEAVLIIDGDLQDPPEMIGKFYDLFKEGYDVVYAIRKNRKSSILLKGAYHIFYRIMKRFSYINIPLDSGDFSLISRRVVEHLNSMPEESRFLRGMRSWVGFKQIGIPYSRDEREKGESKYNLLNLISLALNGLINFSKYPIRFTMTVGIISLIISFIYFIITLYKKVFIGDVPIGFTALLFAIIMFGGLQLIAIGVIGEYILRIFFQVKKRPLFIVKERIQNCEKMQ
ncbi:MAG: glycosyl transferase [Bacteroidetes bacterium GWF2_41_31]|nr:MAG: glycosyl transferase [Bacteroidetes bacterium GWF2_41_31]